LKNTFAKRISKAKQLEATKALERQLAEERKAGENVSDKLIHLVNNSGETGNIKSTKSGERRKGKIRADEG
jgi:hypothetical protein